MALPRTLRLKETWPTGHHLVRLDQAAIVQEMQVQSLVCNPPQNSLIGMKGAADITVKGRGLVWWRTKSACLSTPFQTVTPSPATKAKHNSTNMSTSTAALVLYRNMLREARRVNDYNFRMYAMRRVKQGFVKNRNLQG
jgi:hypothetical protein